MKKLFGFIFSLIMVLACVSVVTACGNKNDGVGSGGNDGASETTTKDTAGDTSGTTGSDSYLKISDYSIDYMKDLMLVNKNVSAYSIKNVSSGVESQSINSQNLSHSLLSSRLCSDGNEDKGGKGEGNKKPPKRNVLYSTTTTYQNGTVKFNENSIEKVTFKKNTNVTKEVYDNRGNLISSETTVKQEELDCQINKLYTTKDFTFIQFVALVEKSGNYNYEDAEGNIKTERIDLRPSSLKYDENGVAEYDKMDYFSSALTVSFVIDNSSGFIYKLENLHIKQFKNGLVVDNKGNYYNLIINSNDELIFSDVMPNKDATIKAIIKDKYGWIFIFNDLISEENTEKKIICTTDFKYLYDDQFNVYTFGCYVNSYIVTLDKVLVDGVKTEIEADAIITGLKPLCNSNINNNIYGQYKNLEDRAFQIYSGAIPPLVTSSLIQGLTDRNGNGIYIKSNVAMSVSWFLHYNCIMINQSNILYYKFVNPDDYLSKCLYLELSDFSEVSEKSLVKVNEYYQEIGDDLYKIKNVYQNSTMNGTQYYQLKASGETIQLIEMKSVEYDDTVFIFQPINK